MLRVKIFACIVLIICSSSAPNVVDPVDTYAKFKALYIYNFPKYFDWPIASKTGNFVIGIFGEPNGFSNELSKIIINKYVGEQKIELKFFAKSESIPKCHILFIPNSNIAFISKVKDQIKTNNTLLITESEGAIKNGSIINFVIKNSKLKFELSFKNAMANKLKVSQSIAPLAILLD